MKARVKGGKVGAGESNKINFRSSAKQLPRYQASKAHTPKRVAHGDGNAKKKHEKRCAVAALTESIPTRFKIKFDLAQRLQFPADLEQNTRRLSNNAFAQLTSDNLDSGFIDQLLPSVQVQKMFTFHGPGSIETSLQVWPDKHGQHRHRTAAASLGVRRICYLENVVNRILSQQHFLRGTVVPTTNVSTWQRDLRRGCARELPILLI